MHDATNVKEPTTHVFIGVAVIYLCIAACETHSLVAQDKSKNAAITTRRQAPKQKGDITFDTIKFEIEKDEPFEREMLTEEIEKLHKQTVTIRGYILPASVYQQSGIKKFVLVRDNQECCFGPGAALYDCVMVEMRGDATASFTTRPVAVKGEFQVKEFKYPGGGGHYAVYQIVAENVK